MPLWSPPETVTTYIGTNLNALANGSFCTVGGLVSNESARYPYIALRLALASLSPTTGASMEIWMVPLMVSTDAASEADENKRLQVSNFLTSFQLDTTAATAQDLVTHVPIVIPPLDFYMSVYNGSGVSLNATGNILYYRRFSM